MRQGFGGGHHLPRNTATTPRPGNSQRAEQGRIASGFDANHSNQIQAVAKHQKVLQQLRPEVGGWQTGSFKQALDLRPVSRLGGNDRH